MNIPFLKSGQFPALTTGSFAAAYTAVSANYTVSVSDYFIECTSSSFTVTLPTAIGVRGQMYNVKNSGTGVITLSAVASQTIDGILPQTLQLRSKDNIALISNNTNWLVM